VSFVTFRVILILELHSDATDVIPTEQESSLGIIEYQAVVSSVENNMKKKRENVKLTDKERYDIGKYCSIHGAIAAIRKFKKSHPHIKLLESTARSLRKKYEELLKSKSGKTELTKLKRGRPLMLGSVDEKVKNFLMILRRKGGVVNSVVAIAAAQALIQKSPEEHLKCIDILTSSWTQSLFRRMGFARRMRTTNKPEIPNQAVKEAKLLFQHQIATFVEEKIINIDQTPLKYAPVSSNTLTKKGTKHVPITGGAFKESITGTFSITYSGKFLPMQLIYKGKTARSFPRVKFPPSFSLSANVSHFSNTQESLKLLDEIIIPYIEKEREELNLDMNQPALLIIDVFSGQTTKPVKNNIKLVKVPANMTHLFQPLDLTVNGAAKAYMKKRFTGWYSRCIIEELDRGKSVDSIDIPLKMSVLKPLHAHWIIDLYNYLTTSEGKEIIANGWKAAYITEALEKGKRGLEPLDPFALIDPLDEVSDPIDFVVESNVEVDQFFASSIQSDQHDEDDDEWLDGDEEPMRNIFEIIDDL